MLALDLVGGAELTTPQVKARYIHNFVKYVTWPETASAAETFQIGLIEEGAVKNALQEVVHGKRWQGKPFGNRSLQREGPFENLHVLYINEPNRDRMSEILQNVPKGTLTIGEGPSFLSKGGMIEFKMSEGKVRFSVNLKALHEAGFAVDSKLLAIAEEVQGK